MVGSLGLPEKNLAWNLPKRKRFGLLGVVLGVAVISFLTNHKNYNVFRRKANGGNGRLRCEDVPCGLERGVLQKCF